MIAITYLSEFFFVGGSEKLGEEGFDTLVKRETLTAHAG
jgi:hypothetical protein